MSDLPPILLNVYPLAMAAFALVYGLAVKNAWFYGAALGSVCGWLSAPGWNLLQHARRSLAGMDYIVWGAASFLLAFFVSLMKMGFFRRPHNRRQECDEDCPACQTSDRGSG